MENTQLNRSGIVENRFTLLRLLGGVSIVAVGCALASVMTNASESFVVVATAVGAAIGMIVNGPSGSAVAAAITWLMIGAILIVAAFISLGYLTLSP